MRMENMRSLRQRRKLSQTDLAEMVGVNQATISKIEKGEMNLTLDKIMAISEALHCQPQELFSLPELQRRALAALGRIRGADQQAALAVLEAMAARQADAPPER